MPEAKMIGTCSPCPLQLEQEQSRDSHLVVLFGDLGLELVPQNNQGHSEVIPLWGVMAYGSMTVTMTVRGCTVLFSYRP